MLARMYPDGATEAERTEIHDVLSAVARNRPDVLLEMGNPRAIRKSLQKRRIVLPAGVTAADVPIMSIGPKLHQCVAMFARKLITALHYKETGQIIPPAGGIAWRWYSNTDAIEGKLPESMIRLLGGRAAVQRARQSLDDQFDYVWGATPDRQIAAYFVTFRASFAITGIASMRVDKLTGVVADNRILRPIPAPVSL